MKRYSMKYVIEHPEYEDPDGEWIRAEDVEALEAKVDVLNKRVDELKELLKPECNCFDKVAFIDNVRSKATTDIELPALTWVCPAHGYKRR